MAAAWTRLFGGMQFSTYTPDLCGPELEFVRALQPAAFQMTRLCCLQSSNPALGQLFDGFAEVVRCEAVADDAPLVEFAVQYLVHAGPYHWRLTGNNKLVPALARPDAEAALAACGVHIPAAALDWLYDPAVDAASICVGDPAQSGRRLWPAGMPADEAREQAAAAWPLNRVFARDGSGTWDVLSTSSTDPVWAASLTIVREALGAALRIAVAHQELFDWHLRASLRALRAYCKSGASGDWHDYMRHWCQQCSRVGVTAGFIETYSDPLHVMGEPALEVGVRAFDLASWRPVLRAMEDALPYAPQVARAREARTDFAVSMEAVALAGGHSGPQVCVAAFCLPNEPALREQCSRQVIHTSLPSRASPEAAAAAQLPGMAKVLAACPELGTRLADVWVMLHETVGHGAGRLLPGVCAADVRAACGGWYNAYEELRAEAAAMFMVTHELERLLAMSALGDDDRLAADVLFRTVVEYGCNRALGRLEGQAPGATEVTQAHAVADVVLSNYMARAGVVELVETATMGGLPAYTFALREGVTEDGVRTHTAALCAAVNAAKAAADAAAIGELLALRQGPAIHAGNMADIAAAGRAVTAAALQSATRPVAVVLGDLSGARAPGTYRPSTVREVRQLLAVSGLF